MSAKRTCAGKVGNNKDPNRGRPCNRWACHGSDFCAVHGGSNKGLLSNPASLENRCTAKAHTTNSQCRNNAIRGGTVCRYHGGASGHVAKKAKQRLLEMVEPALAQLIRIVEQPGTSDSDRLRAIQMVLDRTGYGPGMTVEVEVKPWEITMNRIVREVPLELAASTAVVEDIEDADVVEDYPLLDHPVFGPQEFSAEIIPMPVRTGSAEPPNRNR